MLITYPYSNFVLVCFTPLHHALFIPARNSMFTPMAWLIVHFLKKITAIQIYHCQLGFFLSLFACVDAMKIKDLCHDYQTELSEHNACSLAVTSLFALQCLCSVVSGHEWRPWKNSSQSVIRWQY